MVYRIFVILDQKNNLHIHTYVVVHNYERMHLLMSHLSVSPPFSAIASCVLYFTIRETDNKLAVDGGEASQTVNCFVVGVRALLHIAEQCNKCRCKIAAACGRD